MSCTLIRSAKVLIGAGVMSACDVTRPFRALNEARVVERVTVTPDTVRAAIRDTIVLTAKPIGARDQVVTEAEISWSSGDLSIARSLGVGRFVVVSDGSAELFATAGGRRGVARLVVR